MTTSAIPAFFVDSNVLIYAQDGRDVEKRERAIRVIEAVTRSGRAALSVQVLSEFYSVVTRKGLVSAVDAEAAVHAYSLAWVVLDVDLPAVLEAMRGSREQQLPYYDALIWATARLNGIQTILSEDGQDGSVVEGVRILNPLAASFDLASLS